MTGWVLVENPVTAGKDRSRLEPACHDRSRFLTLQCACGHAMHVHETQFAAIPDDVELASRCHACGGEIAIGIGYLRSAIEEAWT